MIDLDALIVGMLFFIQFFLQGIAWRVAIAHFLMPREEMPPQLPLMVRLEKI